MIIIDTNIIISALIKDSITRKIIIESSLVLGYPEISLNEIVKYKKYIIDKSGIDTEKFNQILSKLLNYIQLIPLDIIRTKMEIAKNIMKDRDINDTVFLAATLAYENSLIWSDDKDFEKQDLVRVIKTRDLVKIFLK